MCEEFDKKLTDFFESFQDFEVCNITDLTYVVQVGFFTSLYGKDFMSLRFPPSSNCPMHHRNDKLLTARINSSITSSIYRQSPVKNQPVKPQSR